MPTITATVHQVLRYFFVGALAAAFVTAPPGDAWSGRFTSFLERLPSAPLVGIAMLIVGSLVYIAHRVIVYPWIFRYFVLPVFDEETSKQTRRPPFLPYGRALSGELQLEELGSHIPEDERERFVGWASEIQLGYLTTEIALVTLALWRITCLAAAMCGLCLIILLVLVVAWDRHQMSVLVDRGRRARAVRC